jgi:hypothetical protein
MQIKRVALEDATIDQIQAELAHRCRMFAVPGEVLADPYLESGKLSRPMTGHFRRVLDLFRGRFQFFERGRAYAIALKVIDDASLTSKQKEELTGMLFAPMLDSRLDSRTVTRAEIMDAVHRACRILDDAKVAVRHAPGSEIQWVNDTKRSS